MVAGRVLALAAALFAAGCASIPGETGAEQATSVDELISKTLADLETQSPAAKEQIKNSVGYVIMNNKLTKIPVFGAGSGYGVAVETATGQRTYLRMRRVDFGAGWGARSVRPVLIFHDPKAFQEYIDGKWSATMGAEAAAKVGESGAAGGAGASGGKHGYVSYMITDAGVSATASAAVIRVKPVRLKK